MVCVPTNYEEEALDTFWRHQLLSTSPIRFIRDHFSSWILFCVFACTSTDLRKRDLAPLVRFKHTWASRNPQVMRKLMVVQSRRTVTFADIGAGNYPIALDRWVSPWPERPRAENEHFWSLKIPFNYKESKKALFIAIELLMTFINCTCHNIYQIKMLRSIYFIAWFACALIRKYNFQISEQQQQILQ